MWARCGSGLSALALATLARPPPECSRLLRTSRLLPLCRSGFVAPPSGSQAAQTAQAARTVFRSSASLRLFSSSAAGPENSNRSSVASSSHSSGPHPHQQASGSPIPPSAAGTAAAAAEDVDAQAPPTPETLRRRWKKNFCRMIKLELNALVCVTTAAGYLLGGGTLFAPLTLVSLCAGSMSLSITASVLNQLMERQHDAQMNRTRTRPLVTGFFSTPFALATAAATLSFGTAALWLGTTPATTAVGLATVALYAGVYTPLKRYHRWNTEVGAVVGALPPIMGWLATDGHSMMSPQAFLLFALLYSWQMSHFMCICWNVRQDYARAGYHMISHPGFDPTGIKTVRKGMFWTGVLAALPLVAVGLNIATPMFLVSSGAFNAYFLYVYSRFYRERLRNPAAARRALRWGFLQLLSFLVLLVFHLKDRDNIRAFADLQLLREVGYKACLHRYENLQALCRKTFGSGAPATAGAGVDASSDGLPEGPQPHLHAALLASDPSAACPVTGIRRALAPALAATIPEEEGDRASAPS